MIESDDSSDFTSKAIRAMAEEYARLKASELELINARKVITILVKRAGGEVHIPNSELLELEPNATFTAKRLDPLDAWSGIVLRVKP